MVQLINESWKSAGESCKIYSTDRFGAKCSYDSEEGNPSRIIIYDSSFSVTRRMREAGTPVTGGAHLARHGRQALGCTHFLFRCQPAARENTRRDTRDSSQWQTRPAPVPPPQPVVPPVPPTPPTPPTPPAPPAPPIPPVPPAPPVQLEERELEQSGHNVRLEQDRPGFWICVAGNIKKPPVELTLKWISAAWKSVPKELIQRAFLTCDISNALDGSQDKLCLQHRRDELEGEEVDMDDEIAAHGFFCNNVEEPESDSEADPDDPTAADD
ncbi:unnamed protein product [Closterium sp. NIES-54]